MFFFFFFFLKISRLAEYRFPVFDGDGTRRSASAMVDLYASWIDRYPIVSIEDGPV